MTTHPTAGRPRGVTLLELLVVMAIIMILLSLVGIIAAKTRERAQMDRTKSLLSRIQVAMEIYIAHWRDYPSPNPDAPDRSWPTGDYTPGDFLPRKWLTDRSPGASFNREDYDPNDDNFFVDSWGTRILYRKAGPDKILLWSAGKNKVFEIGRMTGLTASEKARDRLDKPDVDDISMLDVDH